MIKSNTHQSKVLDGPMSLGAGFIDVATFTMNGGPLQAGFTLNVAGGIISRDAPIATDKTLFEFKYDYFTPANVSITTDKVTISADGIEQATLTVTCEDTTETTVVLAVYKNNIKLGTFNVTVSAGSGTQAITIAEAGTYEYRTDPATVDSVWSLPKFRDTQIAVIKGI